MDKCKRCKTANPESNGYCQECYIISLESKIKLSERLINQYVREREAIKNALSKLDKKLRLLMWKRNAAVNRGGTKNGKKN